MNEIDVTPQMNFSTDFTPEQAGKNIQEANQLGIGHDAYVENKSELEPIVKKQNTPTVATERVAETVGSSTQMAALSKDELQNLNYFERQMHLGATLMRGKDLDRDANEIIFNKVVRGEHTEEDAFNLAKINAEKVKLNSEDDYGFSFWETIPAQIPPVAKDFLKGIGDNYKIVAGAAALTALPGAIRGGATGGPVGAAIGAGVGASIGAVKAGFIVGTFDQYKQTLGSVYNDLDNAIKPNGEPLNLPEAEKRSISQGVAVFSSVVSLAGDYALAKTVPWLGKALSPKAMYRELLKPQNAKWLNVTKLLGNSELAKALAHGAQAEGAEEFVQQIGETVGKAIGNSYDGSEVSVLAGLQSLAESKTYSDAFKAGVVGAVAGGTFTAAGRTIGKATSVVLPTQPEIKVGGGDKPVTVKDDFQAPTDIAGIDSILPSPMDGVKALQLQTVLAKGSALTQQSKLKEFAPEELTKLRKKIAEDAGVPHVWVDPEAIPEGKREKVRNLIDPTGTLATNAPIQVETHKFMDMIDDDMSLSGIAQAEPQILSADEYMKRFKENEAKREKALKGAPKTDSKKPEQITKVNEPDAPGSEQEYRNQPTFTEAMRSVLPESEMAKFDEAQAQAKLVRVEAIDDSAENEMNRVIDVHTEIDLEVAKEIEAEKASKDPNVDVVERFKEGRVFGILTPEQKAFQEKGQPVIQIDPAVLPKYLRDKYLDDPILKKRKVFAKKGKDLISTQNPDDVARMFGVPNIRSFLEIMSKTLDKNQSIKAAEDLRAPQARLEAENAVDLNETAIVKMYEDRTANHLSEMKTLLNQNWSALKIGIKRISLKLPTSTELRSKAIDAINVASVKSLNVAQWRIGENKSQTKATNAILKNQVTEAFAQKENAALNSELARATQIAIGKVNRATKRIARFTKAVTKAELNEAGPLYANAVKDVLETFGFDRSKVKQAKEDAYRKFADRMAKTGQGDFSIPPEVQQWLAGKSSPQELSTEQYLWVADKLEEVLRQARMKNSAMDIYRDNVMTLTTNILADTIHQELVQHPDYHEDKGVTSQGNVGYIEQKRKEIGQLGATMTNIQFIVHQLDKGIFNGLMSKLIWHPIKGIGEHKNGVYGETAALALTKEVDGRVEKLIKDYGSEFTDLNIKKVKIPAFEGIKTLSDGNLTHMDLLMMLLHSGNDYNTKMLENFGVSKETIFKVLQDNLTQKDFDFAQGVWDTFESLKERVRKNRLLTHGTEPEFVQPVGFVAHGKEYRGGYMPLKYKRDTDAAAIVAAYSRNDKIQSGELARPEAMPAFEGIVRTPFAEKRTGSEWEVNLGAYTLGVGLQEVSYGVTMAVPVKAVMEVLTDKNIATDIINTVGTAKYNVLVNSVAEATNSLSAQNSMLFNESAKALNKFSEGLGLAFAAKSIFLNISSVAIQLDSMRNVVNKMGGLDSLIYLNNAAAKLAYGALTGKLPEMYKAAGEIDPSIESYRQGLDDVTYSGINESLPKKRAIPSKPYHMVKNAQEWALSSFFKNVLGGVDITMKTVTALASYNQFIDGKAPGHPMEVISKMGQDELNRAAMAYASEMSSTSLTSGTRIDRAPIQKNPNTMLLAKFWNDGRNSLNSNVQLWRMNKYDIDAAIRKAKKGDMLGASLAYHDAGDRILRTMIVSLIGLKFQVIARSIMASHGGDDDQPNVITPRDEEGPIPFALRSGLQILDEQFLQNTVGVRDLGYAVKSYNKSDAKRVSGVYGSAMSDVATSAAASWNFTMNLLDGMNTIEAAESLSEPQMKALLSTGSIAVGGLPVNGAFKFYNYLMNDEGTPGVPPGLEKSFMDDVMERANDFIHKFDTKEQIPDASIDQSEEEAFQKALKQYHEKSQVQEAVDEVKTAIENTKPVPTDDVLTQEGYEIIKYAESGGKGDARPKKYLTDTDGNLMRDKKGRLVWGGEYLSSAYGHFQFTQSTWEDDVLANAPKSLHLTKKGRTDEAQQLKAMKWYTKRNSKILKENDVPINLETLYGAHHFGAEGYATIYNAPGDSKTKRVLSKSVFKANPWLKQFKYVSEIKGYIKDRLAQGKKAYETATR